VQRIGAHLPTPPDPAPAEADAALAAGAGEDAVLAALTAGRNAYAWRWTIPYTYCHYNERLQMSGFLRLMEEAKDRFVRDRGISIKTLLDDRKWIPVVPRASLRIVDEALMEEDLYTVFTVAEVFKDFTYTARLDCYAARDGRLRPVAAGSIVHGYAVIDNRRDWRLVSFDQRVLDALRGTPGGNGTPGGA
jgi:acyl-CoA thioesterase FadM